MTCQNCLCFEVCREKEMYKFHFMGLPFPASAYMHGVDERCEHFKDNACFAEAENIRKENEALRAFKSCFGELYGTGLEVANWHQNGSTEAFDNFFDAAEDEYIKVIEREGQSND